MLHRDIKPTNILVAEIDGRPVPKIIDFGIAKVLNATSFKDLTMLTQADQVLGTPLYMSPEQIEGGRELDARTDVYALGVLLYQLLTGAPPFDPTLFRGGDFASKRRLILETTPERPSTRVRRRTTSQGRHGKKLHSSQRTLSSDLDWITLKALEKSRDRRYPSALELAADIRRHLDHQRVLARPPGQWDGVTRWIKRHRTGCTAAAVGCVLSVSIFAGLILWRDKEDGEQAAPLALDASGHHTNSLGMKFVPVPGTDVLMCIHETRIGDYAKYAGEVPGVDGRWTSVFKNAFPADQRDSHPVLAVRFRSAHDGA